MVDKYHTKAELNGAVYEARKVLNRLHPTVDELRQAGEGLNKAVVTLHNWIAAAQREQDGLRAALLSARKKMKRMSEPTTGPLIPLTQKGN